MAHCKNCRFWTGDPMTQGGTCRGAPPQLIPQGGNLMSMWPRTGRDDQACAVFKSRLPYRSIGFWATAIVIAWVTASALRGHWTGL